MAYLKRFPLYNKLPVDEEIEKSLDGKTSSVKSEQPPPRSRHVGGSISQKPKFDLGLK
jgi:hypothetical protein